MKHHTNNTCRISRGPNSHYSWQCAVTSVMHKTFLRMLRVFKGPQGSFIDCLVGNTWCFKHLVKNSLIIEATHSQHLLIQCSSHVLECVNRHISVHRQTRMNLQSHVTASGHLQELQGVHCFFLSRQFLMSNDTQTVH